MKWLAERLALSLGFLLLVATGAGAQVVVEGTLKPEEAPGVREEILAPPTPASQRWSLRLGTGEVVDKVEGGGPELDGGFTGTWERPRGAIKFTGTANDLFNQSGGVNQFVFDAGLNASYMFSPRLFWNVGDDVSSTYARDTAALSASSLLPPSLLTHVNTTSSDLRYDLAPRTQIRWMLSDQIATFGSSAFGAGSTISTHVAVTHQVGLSETLGVTGDYQRLTVSGTVSTVQGVLATWQQRIGESISIVGAGGAHMYTTPGQPGFQTAPSGSFGFNAHPRPNDTFAVSLDRTFETALGLGTHLTEAVTATYGLSVGSHLTLNGGGNYARGSYPLDPTHKLIGRTVNVGGRYLLPYDLSLIAAWSLYSRTDIPNPTVISIYRTTMSLTYGRTWH